MASNRIGGSMNRRICKHKWITTDAWTCGKVQWCVECGTRKIYDADLFDGARYFYPNMVVPEPYEGTRTNGKPARRYAGRGRKAI